MLSYPPKVGVVRGKSSPIANLAPSVPSERPIPRRHRVSSILVKLIEVPLSKDVPVAKQQPPTLFVLKDGGRLESRYYLLTVQSLQIEIGGQQRTIPVSTLDLDATIAANHNRGIEVIVPRNQSTVFLGF